MSGAACRYLRLVVQPPDEDGASEVWGVYEETVVGLGKVESDGIIGWLYRVSDQWVWLDEAGHPRRVLGTNSLIAYLESLAPVVSFPETYQQPEDR